ncbi:MAG: gamma carbonic anhydrase family protein [Gammaproteobacteria bacterium]|nr:gamma carbonic anhydrase family protein [Gammaproteobacteria bacterium]
MIYQLEERRVRAEGDYWVAENATLIGAVLLKHNANVWFGAVLRGDRDTITIGENTNIQDLCVLHTDLGFPLALGSFVTVGHKAMLHGCTVGDNTLIGINAVILNGAKVGANCLIGAGALITENKEIPDGSLVMGAPAKIVRSTTPDQVAMMKQQAQGYVDNFKRYKQGLSNQFQAELV